MMVTWSEFEASVPEMAAAGRALLYQFGPGLGFLATVRTDGGPRLHPICPFIADGALCAFIIASPKRADLLRDGRYALHTFPPAERDDEFYLTGVARLITDQERRARAYAVYTAQGTTTGEDDPCFEFLIAQAMHAAYKPRSEGNAWPPTYTRWRAADDR
jgi:hypothetical protein